MDGVYMEAIYEIAGNKIEFNTKRLPGSFLAVVSLALHRELDVQVVNVEDSKEDKNSVTFKVRVGKRTRTLDVSIKKYRNASAIVKLMSEKFNKKIKPVSKLEDPNNYDSRGNKVTLKFKEDRETLPDVIEPYDPAYITEEEDKNPYTLDKSEEAYIRKINLLKNRLRKLKISYNWDDKNEQFLIRKTLRNGTEKTVCFWVYEDTLEYAYGDVNKHYVSGGNLGVVMEKALISLNIKK